MIENMLERYQRVLMAVAIVPAYRTDALIIL